MSNRRSLFIFIMSTVFAMSILTTSYSSAAAKSRRTAKIPKIVTNKVIKKASVKRTIPSKPAANKPIIKSYVETADITVIKASSKYGAVSANKPLIISKTLNITADNVSVENIKSSADIYLKGNNITLNGVVTTGTIFVDPGKDGSANLNNVAASTIKILSGGENSIHLFQANAGNLMISSDTNVRVEISGTTVIGKTTITSYAIIDSKGGSLGTITVTKTGDSLPQVEFIGTFSEPIIVECSAVIRTAADSFLANLQIAAQSPNDYVSLSSNIGNLLISTQANINVIDNAVIQSVKSAINTNINIAPTARVKQIVDSVTGSVITSDAANGQFSVPVITPIVTPAPSAPSAAANNNNSHEHNNSGRNETVVVPPPVPAVVPITAIGAVSGTPKVGSELTAGALNPAGASASYQWQICDTADGTYTNIPGATSDKYTPAAADVNKFIKVTAAGTGSYSGTVTSAACAQVAPMTVNITSITGVTPPVTGGTPVIAIVESAQYTGTVTWTPSDNPFAQATVYTATIVLTPKAGFTFTGVGANSFTVAGGTATNLADSGIVTAVFPATASSDATVSAGMHFRIDNTNNTIAAGSVEINTSFYVHDFLTLFTKQAHATWKIVSSGTTISTPADFNSAGSKQDYDTLMFGDKLAVKAEDGTIKVYNISVVLGDPVIKDLPCPMPYGDLPAISGQSSTSVIQSSGWSKCIVWGKYRYWTFKDYNNAACFYIAAYDFSNTIAKWWKIEESDRRYVTGASINVADPNAPTITFTFDNPMDPKPPLTIPCSDISIPQP